MKPDVDILIAGAGLVGLALAARLAPLGYRIGLIDKRKLPNERPSEPGLRFSAISPASELLLRSLNAWSPDGNETYAPYRKMHVWDAADHYDSERAIEFHAVDLGLSYLGHIVSNSMVQWSLVEQIRSLPNITVHESVHIENIVFEPRTSRSAARMIVKSDGFERSCSLVVGADGSRSSVRRLAGIKSFCKKYGQHGIVCTVAVEKSHDDTAWQRFAPSGPLAFLPLANKHRCSIVWSTDRADSLMRLNDRAFCEHLMEASDGVLGEIELMSERASFPLSLQYSHDYIKEGIALVGDSAHVIHPLAGQGLNLGFADVYTLATSLELAQARGDSPGDLRGLRRYERTRKLANTKMQGVTHGLNQLFAHQNPMVAQIRSVGLGLVNLAPHLKYALAREAIR